MTAATIVADRELKAALLAARSAADVIAAVTRVAYRRRHPGANCPDDAIPPEATLAAWLPGCPGAALDEARDAAAAVLPWGQDVPAV